MGRKWMQKIDEVQSIYGSITQLSSDGDGMTNLKLNSTNGRQNRSSNIESLTVHHTWSTRR